MKVNTPIFKNLEPYPGTFYDVKRIRKDFPILERKVHGKTLVYFDNAATTQKPKNVIEALTNYYLSENSNVHRGVHYLSEQATRAFEEARVQVQKFINAKEFREIIFTRGTTEAVNLVAQTFGRVHVRKGDEIVISNIEHHSNIVPWQILCEEKGATLRIIPVNDSGELLMDEYRKLLNSKTKLVAVTHVSNALGTITPLRKIVEIAHEHHIPVLVDGAQAAAHLKVDVQALDCDFYTLSGHKVYGPTGIGVLYGKAKLLEEMPPYQGGGDMISSVTFEKTIYNTIPFKFEAGTPNIAGVIGLGAALHYIKRIGIENIKAYEEELLSYATKEIKKVPHVKLIGTAEEKASILSFVMDGIHPHDIGTVLDQEGIAIRTGHHCAQPVMDRFGVVATARASFGIYNTKEEIDHFIQGLYKVLEVFK